MNLTEVELSKKMTPGNGIDMRRDGFGLSAHTHAHKHTYVVAVGL